MRRRVTKRENRFGKTIEIEIGKLEIGNLEMRTI